MKKARLTVRLTAAMLTLSLLTIPAIAADPPASAVRVNSYKGNTLAVGERSGLIILDATLYMIIMKVLFI